MKMKAIIKTGVTGAALLFFIQYSHINNGHWGAYSARYLTEHEMNEKVRFDDNFTYYQYQFPDCSITVLSADHYSFDDFCKKYAVNKEDFFMSYSIYIHLDIILENNGSQDASIQLSGLFLRGKDWFCPCDDYATGVANGKQKSFFSVEDNSNISIRSKESIRMNLVYGLQRGNFPLSRWNRLFSDPIWLVATIIPSEQRIRLLFNQ